MQARVGCIHRSPPTHSLELGPVKAAAPLGSPCRIIEPGWRVKGVIDGELWLLVEISCVCVCVCVCLSVRLCMEINCSHWKLQQELECIPQVLSPLGMYTSSVVFMRM